MGDISIDHPFVDDDEQADVETEETGNGRRWPIGVVSILVAVVAIGAVLYVAASHYQPLSQVRNGEYGSEVLSGTGTLATNTTVASNPGVVWTEPSGSFRVEVIVSLNNDQRFGVTINRVLAPANPSGTSNVHVYFDTKSNSKVSYGYKGGPAFTATTLASKGQLQLVVHWVQQCVPQSAQSGPTTYTSLPVEYTFVGFHHTVNVPIQPRLTISPATC